MEPALNPARNLQMTQVAIVVILIQMADSASWVMVEFISGLPLLSQIIRTTRGTWISTTEAWAATIRIAAIMSDV